MSFRVEEAKKLFLLNLMFIFKFNVNVNKSRKRYFNRHELLDLYLHSILCIVFVNKIVCDLSHVILLHNKNNKSVNNFY
jgi:hypothetical protein